MLLKNSRNFFLVFISNKEIANGFDMLLSSLNTLKEQRELKHHITLFYGLIYALKKAYVKITKARNRYRELLKLKLVLFDRRIFRPFIYKFCIT